MKKNKFQKKKNIVSTMLKIVIGGLSFLRLNFFCRTLNSIVFLFDKVLMGMIITQ